ncbi:DUF2975 domain-containing protein [Lutibacter sp.]
MRKIHVLKAIVDFIWIVSIPFIPIFIITIPLLFMYEGFGDFTVTINGIKFNLETIDIPVKIFLTISMLLFLLILYCIYLFRKILAYFLRVKIFDNLVISSFKKIGDLLVIYSLLSMILKFTFKVFHQQKVEFTIGLNVQISLLCLGLFFMILSEIFNIARIEKQENDLTI